MKATAQAILAAQLAALAQESPTPYTFYEYWNPQTLQHGGTPKLCFSAIGTLFSLIANDIHASSLIDTHLLIH